MPTVIPLLFLAACNGQLLLSGATPTASAKIQDLDTYKAKEGDVVHVTGRSFTQNMHLTIDDAPVDLKVVSETEATFVYTGTGNPLSRLTFKNGDSEIAIFPLANAERLSEVPVADIPADQLCATQVVRNTSNELVKGTATCDERPKNCAADGAQDCIATAQFPHVLVADVPAKVLSGQTVAGISGTVSNRPVDCSQDGQSSCVVDGVQMKSVDMSLLHSSDLRLGVQFAGLTGTIVTNPAHCAIDGATGCLTDSNFPAVDKQNSIVTKTAFFRTGFTILGTSGTLGPCASDGSSGCLVDDSTSAALQTSGAASKILSGQTLGGVAGTGAGLPADCSSDGQTNCRTTTAFPSVEKARITGGLASISSSLSIAGQTGSLANCSSEGQAGCFTVTNFPAADKSNLISNLSKIRTGTTILSQAGSLADCATDGSIGCVSVTNFPALAKTGAASKILTGQTLGGVAGSAAIRPADCAVDGGTNCVAVTNFPALDGSVAAARILSSAVLGGIAGTASIRPADCNSDGETDCVTVSSYPALKKANLTGEPNKLRSDTTLLGVTGTLNDCASDGDTDCVAVGPIYKAAAVAGLGAKILTGSSVAGVSGTVAPRPANCTADGAIGCIAVAGFPAAQVSGAAAKIILGQTLATVTGTAGGYRPSTCASDGELSCVTDASFTALNASTGAAKIAAGDSLGGVAGTASVRPSDCSIDGATNCVASTNFPTINKADLSSNAAKLRSSLTVAGVTGTFADCAGDGNTNCYAVGGYPAALSTGAAAKILTGSTVAGISGSASLRPADCSADGTTGCVTITNYPAIDKSTISAGKMRTSLTLGGVAGSLADCAVDGSTNCFVSTNYAAMNATGAAAKILSGQTVGAVSGTGAGLPADCTGGSQTNCVTVTAYPALSTTWLNTAKTSMDVGQTIAGVTGTIPLCSTDGETGCEPDSGTKSMNASGAAAKIASGSTLGGIAGTGLTLPATCSADGSTGCTTSASYPAVNQSVLSGKAGKFKSGISIAGVAGSLANCSSDGQNTCVAVTGFPSAQISGAAAKIRTSQIVAGVTGTAPAPPSNCAADAATNCVAVAAYPAINKSTMTSTRAANIANSLTLGGVAGTLVNCSTDNQTNCLTSTTNPAVDKVGKVSAGVIKSGTVIAGVTGAYPSATYTLPGATVATDLTSSNFNTFLASSSSYEYWTTSGTRVSSAGYASTFISANLHKPMFGVSAGYLTECTADNQTGCVTNTTYKAMKLTNLTSWNLRRGKTLGGVAGKILFAKNGTILSLFNRTTGTAASTSTSVSDAYDTIDDTLVDGTTAAYGNPTGIPSVTGWNIATDNDVIIRDPATDTNSNGACDSGEACIVLDRNTNKYWARYDTNPGSWESLLGACIVNAPASYGTGWHLPTQKEIEQVYIDGIAFKTALLNLPNGFYDTATTYSSDFSQTWPFNPNNGHSPSTNLKTTSRWFLCVRDN